MSVNGQSDEGGTILVLTAMLLVVFLGLAALAVDAAMAWSGRRVAQGIADTSVMAALQAFPGSTSESAARNAADDFTARNSAANASSVAVTRFEVVTQPGQVDVELDVEYVADALFGPAIGGPADYELGATAEGRIEVYLPGEINADGEPTMRLFPLGLPSGTAARLVCSGSPCPPGAVPLMEVIGMRRTSTGCTDADETTTGNLAGGVDHLIGLDADLRDEREACEFRLAGGHLVSLPTTSRLVPSSRVPYSNGFVPLLGQPQLLWDYLIDGLPGACDSTTYDPAAPIDALTVQMRQCLVESPTRPLFTGLGIHDVRLGWGVFTQPGGSDVRYVNPAVFWIHSVSDATGQSTAPTGTGYTAATAFRLDPDMLPAGFASYIPLGRDGLEFSLID